MNNKKHHIYLKSENLFLFCGEYVINNECISFEKTYIPTRPVDEILILKYDLECFRNVEKIYSFDSPQATFVCHYDINNLLCKDVNLINVFKNTNDINIYLSKHETIIPKNKYRLIDWTHESCFIRFFSLKSPKQ